jgi:hypothetical protein
MQEKEEKIKLKQIRMRNQERFMPQINLKKNNDSE